ncbi:MAG: CBS domain-containing protein [Candidatus Micrarchaeota archaeon]
METGIKVGDCMRTSLITINEEASVFDAAKLLTAKNVGSLLVKDKKGKIYAILTDEDLVRRALAKNKLHAQVSSIASKPLIGLTPDKDLSEAARIMGSKKIKRLVVFKDKSSAEPVGIISESDIIRISPSLYDLIAERERIS